MRRFSINTQIASNDKEEVFDKTQITSTDNEEVFDKTQIAPTDDAENIWPM
jgi:hypothetical protein